MVPAEGSSGGTVPLARREVPFYAAEDGVSRGRFPDYASRWRWWASSGKLRLVTVA